MAVPTLLLLLPGTAFFLLLLISNFPPGAEPKILNSSLSSSPICQLPSAEQEVIILLRGLGKREIPEISR